MGESREIFLFFTTPADHMTAGNVVTMFQKFNAFHPVIPDSDLNPCPDNASVALAFVYADSSLLPSVPL